MNVVMEHWQYFLTLSVSVIGGAFALWRFLLTRHAELAWRRTRFVFDQSRYLETDPELTEVLKLLTGNHPAASLDDVLDEDTSLDEEEVLRLKHALDKFLNFFDRMFYAVHVVCTLKLDELSVFSWYLEALLNEQELMAYCRDNGFHDVVRLAQEVINRND